LSEEEVVKELIEIKERSTGKKLTPLYETQKRALEAGLLKRKDNFVIIAPTASGKTLNAEFAIYQSLKKHEKTLYVTPTTALCSDKEKEFAYLNDIGYTVTAREGWSKADVVITTFETFYRVALTNLKAIEQFRLAIVDEFHILYDATRGFNLEKAITLLKKIECRIICLSATFEDRNEIKEWLKAELVEIPEQFRKVRLKPDIIDLTTIAGHAKQVQALNQWLLTKVKDYGPEIIFCSNKQWTRARALQIAGMMPESLSAEQKEKIKADFFEAVSREELTGLEIDLLESVQRRVAFHHSGLHRNLRNLIEQKFLNREIDFLFATTGLAYGINFPAKTVVLCDLTLPFEGKAAYIPVYMFIQMAGRAGRPQFGKEGYTFIVAKDAADKLRAQKLLEGKLERAYSQITNDDFFQKFILELIYSDRKKEDELIGFLKDTFYYFQSTRQGQRSLMTFSFDDILKRQLEYLTINGFVEYLGVPGFRMLDLGNVTVDFLMETYQIYRLRDFVELNKFLERKKVCPDFELILKISREFEGAKLFRIPNERSETIDKFYEKAGVTKPSHAEYSAYSIFYGWMENMPEHQIESDFNVYASALENVSKELYNLLIAYEKLAKRKNMDIPQDWDDFKDRMLYGVRKDELPFARRKGIKRNIVRNLYNYCQNFLKGPMYNYKGDMLEVLRRFYDEKGESFVLTDLIDKKIGIGPARASTIIDIVNEYKK
jgi:helicase